MKTIFFTTKNHVDIAQAEIEMSCDCFVEEIQTGIFQGEPKRRIQANRFGFVKEICILQKKLSKENYLEELTNEDIHNTYKIRVISSDGIVRTKQLADEIYAKLDNPMVDLELPDYEYVFLFLEQEVLLLRSVDKNTDTPEERKAHKKLHNHPTSIDPKLAKATINLSGKDSFHDPFCGLGGLVIEGALQGLQASGSDIAPGLLIKAQENAQEYGLAPQFFQEDALQLTQKYSALITDLPYGRNSTLSQNMNSLYKEFFKHAQTLTSTLVVGMMDETNEQELLEGTSWKLQHKFIVYVHKSLSRKLLLLQQQL